MCRLACFPPKTSQAEALEILLEMEGTKNIDGVGCAYIDANGKFVCQKWAVSLSKIIEDGIPFMQHMAGEGHNGWTIAHVRAMSRGAIAIKNTHPFIIDDKWAFAQNGTWNDYSVVKLALSKTVKFEGETDTEVAGHLFSIAGPREFCGAIDNAGVFLGLRKDGSLYIVKTSGLLEFNEFPDKRILAASDLKQITYPQSETVQAGWYYFNKSGKLIKSGKKALPIYTGQTYAYSGRSFGGDRWLPEPNKAKVPSAPDDDDSEYTSSWF
jgi:hypothetical protein